MHTWPGNQLHLELVCRLVAFHLHSDLKKDERAGRLLQRIKKVLNGRLGAKECALAMRELVDPCNVFVPTGMAGTMGFGHLRYQEYWAARHICLDRSVDITGYLTQPWWRGVFALIAQMSESVESYIINAAESGVLRRAADTVEKMIAVRPPRERRKLKELVATLLAQETAEIEELVADENAPYEDVFRLDELDDEEGEFDRLFAG